ncbi:protein FLX-like 3 [Primulina eburnea]|uniref:protein FLX-like 3 n=1 Tax=Primulina eburnea TaxID=1245227 RepID=UPI003C6CC22A
MAGRNRARESIDHRRGYPPEGPVVRVPLARPLPPHPALLEEELEIQQVELRDLLGENCRFFEDQIALERELNTAKEEVRRMNLAIADIHAEQELLEADLRVTEPLKSEAAQLRAEVQRLRTIKQDLSGQVHSLSQELAKLQVFIISSGKFNQVLLMFRNAIDYEKNANIELREQRQAMENNMVKMARDIEKLRSELANSGARAWSSGGPIGAMEFSNPNSSFPNPYENVCGILQGAINYIGPYCSGSASWDGLEKPWVIRR